MRGRSFRIWWTISGGVLERWRIQSGGGREFGGMNSSGAVLRFILGWANSGKCK
jgi:hypothetical protein